MSRETFVSCMSGRAAFATSVMSTLASWALLHRVLSRTDAQVDWLLLVALRALAAEELSYVGAVALACGWAVWRRSAAALGMIQLYAVVVGLWIVQYRWGQSPGSMIDPRFLLAVMAGITTLYASYLCLIAHAVIALRERLVRPRSAD
jgi:hypothetical protein